MNRPTLQLVPAPMLVGYGLAFLGTALFSAKSIFIKFAYQTGMQAEAVLFWRMVLALPLYLGVLLIWRRKFLRQLSVIKQFRWRLVLVGCTGYFLAPWLDLKGLLYISAGLERTILFTYPIWVVLFGAWFFATPITRRVMASIIITYTGLVIAMSDQWGLSTVSTQLFITGSVLVLLASISFAFYVLWSKSMLSQISSLCFTTLVMLIASSAVIISYSPFIPSTAVPKEAWLYLGLLVVASTFVPSFMVTMAIKRIGGAPTGIVGSLGPIITIILASIFLGEIFSSFYWFGLVAILLGVGLLITQSKETGTP